ncbi:MULTISPECIES: hypothetical protein [unclassified Ruegeria]|uniref:hypothetical protein n=1 Tax=unclassified Ruegeria TaxID=2625375 RepID=UPI001488BC72|nr:MULTISPECIES: hypothetical protein [unclassified Ruegeria]NOD88140.1 hypothetical protein [Ruegeria sp. HKCCD4318]NOE14988.1 hypothetical protein [Ruegeria sp. HKCCD4318-2]NOG11409.1 hypothetical protein [Ruegeria sp. HKCCD4315]
MKFSDETLLAYLEGTLDETQSRAIEAAVEEDSEFERRLMALDPFAPVIQKVFETLPAEAPKIELPEPVEQAPGGGVLRLFAVAASVGAAAVALTFWATRPADLGWAQQAAIYQSLYVPETIASLDSSEASLNKQFEMAEAELGRSLNRETLESLPGLELKRAQVLSFKGKPLIQVVFADEQGQPFAFCIIRQGPDAPPAEIKQAVLSGLATATWAQDGYGYMLLGSSPQTDLQSELDVLTRTFAG